MSEVCFHYASGKIECVNGLFVLCCLAIPIIVITILALIGKKGG